ncbi:MAG: response regulator transcription factor [Polaromonas sp.]|nr:response regulator transcription factor [Polaromonas sp.]
MLNLHSPGVDVLVIHPAPMVAAGIARILENSPCLVGVVESVSAVNAGDDLTRFQVIITDYPTALQLSAIPVSKGAQGRRHRLIVVATFHRESEIRSALEKGVLGYLLLGCTVRELQESVRSVGRGNRFLSQDVARSMAESLTREDLTIREQQVLQLLARGHSNKSIALKLGVALGTVKAHVKAVLGKLDASSRTEALSIAVQRGLVMDGAVIA